MQNPLMKKYSFPPISNDAATVLILGTMPGEKSLSLNQYYGHSRNDFWKLLFTIFETPFSTDYDERQELILNNKVALWDVLQICEREGSLDSAIKKEAANDFSSFLKDHPNIRHIFFNGQKAAAFFKRYVPIGPEFNLTILPSTSPANAGISFEKKLEQWKMIR